MESYGEKLKQARLEKDYSLEQVAQETHISKRFIVAMEDENSSIFPAETYLMGFLRNYAEYLGLDSENILTLYRNIKIQEQPIPMDELLHGKNKPVPVLLILAIIAGTAVLGFGGFFAYHYFINLDNTQVAETTEETAAEEPQDRVGEEFNFSGGVLSQPFGINDTINIKTGNNIYKITIKDIADKATLTLPEKTIQLNLLDPYNLDTNRDSVSDVELVLTDIDSIDNNRRVIMRITEIGTMAINIENALASQKETTGNTEQAENTQQVTTPPVNHTEDTAENTQQEVTTTTALVSGNRQIVLNSSRTKSFTLNLDFTGNCFVRYSIDEGSRVEHFYQKNDPSLVIDTARSSITLWLSNAGAVDADIDGVQISMGSQGQVSTRQIEWIKNSDSGEYELVVISAD